MAIRGNQQRFVGLPGPRSLTNGQNSGDVRGTHQAPAAHRRKREDRHEDHVVGARHDVTMTDSWKMKERTVVVSSFILRTTRSN